MLRDLWTHRHLVVSLTRSQYQLRFRQSFAGLLWAVVPPIATLGVAIVVFHGVAGVRTGTTSYAVFALAGLVPWTFFNSSVLFGVPSVMSFPLLIQRLPFPRAALPLSVIGVSLIDLAISTAMFAVVAVVLGTGIALSAAWFPVLIAIEVVFVIGIVLLGSAVNVFARDVRLAIPFAAQLLLFLTPVMYPLSSVPERLRPWYRANPMSGLIESFRDVLVLHRSPALSTLAPALIGAGVAFLVGVWYFARTERRFADVI